MKTKIFLIVLSVTIICSFTTPVFRSVPSHQSSASVQSYWYNEGFNDGYLDAVSHRTYMYSANRRLIPEWVYCSEYKPGYNDGWIVGGGSTPVTDCVE